MRLEDQVCSLELARKLKELGVKQDSLFYWWHRLTYHNGEKLWDIRITNDDNGRFRDNLSAFTVAELGSMLGKYIKDIGYSEYYKHFPVFLDIGEARYADSEADARAIKVIYLIETGIIKQ